MALMTEPSTPNVGNLMKLLLMNLIKLFTLLKKNSNIPVVQLTKN